MKVVRKSTIILSHIFLCLGAILMLYPFVFALLGMFKTIEGFYEVNFLPVPDGFRYGFENLGIIFRRTEIYSSILLTLGRFVWYGFILVVTSVLGGYAFAKVNFKFKKVAFYVIMSTMMIPGIALLIPQYLELMRFPLVGGNDILGHGGTGFRDNMAVLFITGWFSAYNIFLVRQSLQQIGNDYREAAEIDGAGIFPHHLLHLHAHAQAHCRAHDLADVHRTVERLSVPGSLPAECAGSVADRRSVRKNSVRLPLYCRCWRTHELSHGYGDGDLYDDPARRRVHHLSEIFCTGTHARRDKKLDETAYP